MKRLAGLSLVVTLLVLVVAAPATAVVDEIVGAWCSGQSLQPPGINGSKHEHNEAQPLFASGVIADFHFDNHGDGVGPHVVFDFSRPNIKLVQVGGTINVGEPGDPFYIEAFTLDPDFPAFQNCPNLLTFP